MEGCVEKARKPPGDVLENAVHAYPFNRDLGGRVCSAVLHSPSVADRRVFLLSFFLPAHSDRLQPCLLSLRASPNHHEVLGVTRGRRHTRRRRVRAELRLREYYQPRGVCAPGTNAVRLPYRRSSSAAALLATALATRLSLGLPKSKILLIEAGPAALDDLRINIPGFRGSILGSTLDWNFTTVPPEGLDGRSIDVNRGKVLGAARPP